MFFTKISYLFLALRAGSAAAAQDILWLAYEDVMAMLFIAMLSKQVGRALHALCCVPLCEGLKAIVCVPCAVHVCLRAAQVCQHAPNSRDLPQLASRLHTFTDQCGRGVDEQSNEQSNKQSNKQTLSKTEAQCSLFRSEAPLLFHALLTRHDMFVCCSMALDDTPWRRSVRECMQRGCVDGCQDPAAQNTHICESVSQLRCTTQTCTCCPPRDLPALQAWALQAFGAGHTYMHTHTHTHTRYLHTRTHTYMRTCSSSCLRHCPSWPPALRRWCRCCWRWASRLPRRCCLQCCWAALSSLLSLAGHAPARSTCTQPSTTCALRPTLPQPACPLLAPGRRTLCEWAQVRRAGQGCSYGSAKWAGLRLQQQRPLPCKLKHPQQGLLATALVPALQQPPSCPMGHAHAAALLQQPGCPRGMPAAALQGGHGPQGAPRLPLRMCAPAVPYGAQAGCSHFDGANRGLRVAGAGDPLL